MHQSTAGVRWPVLLLAGFALLLTLGCEHKAVRQPLRANHFAPGMGEPTLLAAYQPWFGRPGHINVGYSSQDRVMLEKQIDQASKLGIAAFVVNWYGAHHEFEDRSYATLQQAASDKQFRVAIMYDEADNDPAGSTDATISDLQYAYDRYIGPRATVPNGAYLRYNGRPMIFIFPKGGRTDWNRVRQAVNTWQEQPLLIFKDINQQYANDFDGFYAWVNPGPSGWQRDGSAWGEQYLEHFYQTMLSQYPDKIAIGAAWPGFDDSKASWSLNRHMDTRCGKTFDDTLRLYHRYYTADRQLPFLMIVTWNDYEEGTAIENGVETCK